MVARSVLICFVPRAGSWFLCGLMASTGVLGAPGQYFWEPGQGQARQRHRLRTDEEYLAWVLAEGTSANGTFGCKFELHELKEVVQRLRLAAADEDAPDGELLARAFPNPCYVWLRRQDTVAQAVSWLRAIQTKQWRSNRPVLREASFDPERIRGLVDLIGQTSDAWAAWFAEQRIEPHVVSYEDLVADRRQALEGIAEAAGVSIPAEVELRPYADRERQADDLNEEWARQYRDHVAAEASKRS